MGSTLEAVLANISMGWFEKEATITYGLIPKIWLQYVDDTLVQWHHGEDEFKTFLKHLNSIHTKK